MVKKREREYVKKPKRSAREDTQYSSMLPLANSVQDSDNSCSVDQSRSRISVRRYKTECRRKNLNTQALHQHTQLRFNSQIVTRYISLRLRLSLNWKTIRADWLCVCILIASHRYTRYYVFSFKLLWADVKYIISGDIEQLKPVRHRFKKCDYLKTKSFFSI